MRVPTPPENKFFIPFEAPIAGMALPEKFTYPFAYTPHPFCLLAASELQQYLKSQKDWQHNFGLEAHQAGPVIGKMFGVLVVRTAKNNIGYLAAFSGKLAGSFHHARFVPPVFDSLAEGSFLNTGMAELTRINQEISLLKEINTAESRARIDLLKEVRKSNSIALQQKLYDNYLFVDRAGAEKGLRAIFKASANSNPPAGAGECAAPKLLQYAFQQQLEPLAMAEFWWGLSPKSATWKHGKFYPACREKCAPILKHMLQGIAMNEKPLPNQIAEPVL